MDRACMKILIAEDDRASQLMLRKLVEKMGHECLVADDGLGAWELFQKHGAEVIISDWMMPGMDGAELCRRVRQQSASYTYFIFLSALAEKSHFLSAMRDGADDYLTKPLDRTDLEARLIAAQRVTSLHHELSRQKARLQQLNDDLFDQARRDPLTHLWNRLRLREDLEYLQARVERYGDTYAAALCDIDFFKKYNDHYGHLAGDEVLRIVANQLSSLLRKTDTIYRYGGEEFLMLLPAQSAQSALAVIDRVRREIERLHIPHCEAELGQVTISGGIAELATGSRKSVSALLKEADDALYLAKKTGRNRVLPFSEDNSR